jgi:hypothetical protein
MWEILLVVQSAIAALSQPGQIRLAWTENPNELAVRWTTYTISAPPKVAYRPFNCSAEETWSYEAAQTERFKQGWRYFEVQYIHTAVLRNLNASCDYQYQVGTYFYWSELRTISGLTHGNDNNQPISIVLLGDMGVGSNSSDSRDLLTKMARHREMVGVLHLGDIGYNLGDVGGYKGDEFLDDIEPVSSRVAYMTMPGNHEHYKGFIQYIRRFRMPDVTQAPDTNFFYSFDLGKAHFVALNSETYFYLSAEARKTQMNWLTQDLAQADANKAAVPWLIVMAHKPLYCNIDYTLHEYSPHTNVNCGKEANIMRHAWEEVFYQHKVDIYFAGHVHNYQRTGPVYHNQTVPADNDSDSVFINPKAPIYILSGDAGSDHGHEPLSLTPQDWSIYGTSAYGFGKLTVFNETHLLWEQYDAEEQEITDSVWVIKTLS